MKSGQTLKALGEGMGYDRDTARQQAWQFLNKTAAPRPPMLRRFARALGIDVKSLFEK